MDERADAGDAGRRGGGDPALPLAHLIEINALTLEGAGGPRILAVRGVGYRIDADVVTPEFATAE